MKKILFIGAASGLGDRISMIPKLLQLKKEGYYVGFLCYDPRHFTLFYKADEMLELYKDNNLYDELLLVPTGKRTKCKFIIKHLWRFHIAYTPIHTFFSSIRGRLFSLKYTFSFKSLADKDNGTFNNIVDGTLERKVGLLSEYKDAVLWPDVGSRQTTFGLELITYVTLFVSLYVRSIPPQELEQIISYCNTQGWHVVIVGGDREAWIRDKIDLSKYQIIDLLGKTSIADAARILEGSLLNISMDGGLMWLGHLMNPNNISIQNVSAYLMQAPVNNRTSYNLREYAYPQCKPCNHFSTEAPPEGTPFTTSCVFYKTVREGECRYVTKSSHVIYLIKKILHT